MAGRKKMSDEEKAEAKRLREEKKAKEESAAAAATAGLTMAPGSLFAEAEALANATDEELASVERKAGDRWDGPKLLERIVAHGVAHGVEVPIRLEDYQARSEAMAHATEQLLDILPREKATMLATFRERKAKLEEEVDKLRKEVQHHTEKRQVEIEQVAIYDRDGGGVMIWRTKEGHVEIPHRTRPLSFDEKQQSLPLSQRTRKNPPKPAEGDENEQGDLEPGAIAMPDGAGAPPASPGAEDPNAPPFGSKAWCKAGCQGIQMFESERPVFVKAFTNALNHVHKEDNGRDQLTSAEIELAIHAVRQDLAMKASDELAKAPPAVTSPDGGTNQERPRFKPNPDDPDECLGCKTEEFDHEGEEKFCPKKTPALALVQ